jgi:hypothetical protein
MACEITRINGEVMHIRISGVMTMADQLMLQKAGMKVIEQCGNARLLVTLDNFKGWDKGADWGDVGFMLGQGKNITKMAIVGEKRWEDDVLVFVGKGIRTTDIEFFPTSALMEAEDWIHA